MDEAERIMDQHPDSAFDILRKIDARQLRREEDKARHWLLMTMAKDKNDISLMNDSLFSKYVRYYEKKGDPLKMTQAFYYNGVSLFQQQSYPAAIVSFINAYEIAEKDSLAFWAAMSARGVSDLYNETFSVKDELKYAVKELEWFRKDGRQPHLNYAICDYATSLTTNNEFEASIQHLVSLSDSAKKYQDSNLAYSVNQLQSLNYIKTDRNNEAILLLETNLNSEYASERDSVLLAIAFAKIGNTGRAEKLFSPGKRDGLSRLAAFEIAKSRGDYEKAFKEQENLLHVSDSLFLESIKMNLSSSVADYQEIRSEMLTQKLRMSRVIMMIVLIAGAVMVVLLAAIFFYRDRKGKLELALAADSAAELEKKLNFSEIRTQESEQVLSRVLSSKYSLINDLCYTILEGSGSDSAKRKSIDRLSDLVNATILEKESFLVLEKEVDHITKGGLKKFYEAYPNLKTVDKMVFVLTVLDLSGSAIALLLKESNVSSIYNRRRRLKTKILELPEDLQIKLLPYLSRK